MAYKQDIHIWGIRYLLVKILPIYFSQHLPVCPREGNGNPFQYSCLENPMDGGAWKAAVHGVCRSWTRQNDYTFTFHFHALEKEMATHSSVLAWKIPGMGEPGGLPSLGSHRVRHNWSDLAAAAAACIIVHTDLFSLLLIAIWVVYWRIFWCDLFLAIWHCFLLNIYNLF